MRPRILINAISLTQQGGGRSYVRNLLRELDADDRGLDFAILCVRDAITPDEAGRIAVYEARLPNLRGPARTLVRVAYEELWMPLRIDQFAALYCVADLAPAFCPIPKIVALRNFNIYDRRFYDTLRTRALFRLVKAGVRTAAAVITPSRAAAEAIGPLVGIAPDAIHVVHHGISEAAFQTGRAPEIADANYLFLPANLERHKNFEVLFEMMPLLDDPTLELWIAGGDLLDPEWAEHLRRLVRERGLESRVRFLGPVPYERVLAYYRGARALVFPSHLETFGHPLLEAMLSGTPVVASALPSFRELAGDIALYAPANDARAFAARVNETLRDGAATEARVARGRERAAVFTWKASTDRLCDVLAAALRRESDRRR